MQTIEEASNMMIQFENKVLLRVAKRHFKNGVEFAQKWIPVEEDLPEVDVPVLIRTKNGKYKVSSMYIPKDCHGNILGEKRWKGSTSFVESITDWRPITYK